LPTKSPRDSVQVAPDEPGRGSDASAAEFIDAPLEHPEDREGAPSLPSASLAAGASVPASVPVQSRSEGYFEIWKMSWPIMMSQVMVSGVGLIDIMMVGRLGSDAIAAVGYSSQFMFLAISVLFAVGFACVALMARAIGGGDTDRARHTLAASLQVAIVTSLIVSAAVLIAPAPLLRLLGATDSVISTALPFLKLLMGSSVLLAVSMTIENALRANRDTKTPMMISVIVTAVKIAANALLIFGNFGFPRLELVGAGIATVVSQCVGIVLFLGVVARAPATSPISVRPRHFRGARPLLGEVVRLSLPGVGERLAMNFALLAYFRVLSSYGTVPIAAYTVGIRILSFSWIPGTGFGAAAATLVGQALGAGRVEDATRAGWRSTRLAIGVAIVLGALCIWIRDPLARLFTDDLEVVAALGPFLLCLALAQPFLQAHFTLGGAHRGAGDTFTPFIAAVLGNWALRVPLAFVFSQLLHFDVVWVWYALLFDHLMRTTWLALSYRRGRWRDKLGASQSEPRVVT
jgi:putative MATE family efflux protein